MGRPASSVNTISRSLSFHDVGAARSRLVTVMLPDALGDALPANEYVKSLYPTAVIVNVPLYSGSLAPVTVTRSPTKKPCPDQNTVAVVKLLVMDVGKWVARPLVVS